MKLNDRYYTGREVQKLLGITEPSLRNLVNQKKLRKIVPPGRTNGLYLKSEINAFAEKWEAFLMAKEPPKTTFYPATEKDMEAENELDRRAIGEASMSVERRKAWLARNPDGDYHVKHNNRLVAFLRLLPLKHDTIMALIEDRMKGVDIPAEDIEPFEPGKPTEFYIISIASDPDIDETTRLHYMFVLLRGVGDELEKLGRRGVVISRVYAKSQFPNAIAIAAHAGMQEIVELRNKKTLKFVLDVENSSGYLANRYKRGLAEWQKAHKGQERSNRNNRTSHRKAEIGTSA